MMQKMKDWYTRQRLAASLALALGLVLAGKTAQADEEVHERTAFGAVELLVGQDSGTLDAKVLVPMGDELTLLSRNRVTATTEDGSVGSYSVNNIAYGIGEGFAVLGEVDAAPRTGLLPRAGMQHFYAGDGFTIFNLLTVPVDGRDFDLLHIGKITYRASLGEDFDLATAVETLTSVNKEGFASAVQRLRLGAGVGRYQLGAAADLSETSSGDLSVNVGGYTSVSF